MTPLKDQPDDEVRFIQATAHYFGRTIDADEQRARHELNGMADRLDREIAEAIESGPPHIAVIRDRVVQFDADTHQYRLDGMPLPSVTQVIKAVLPSPYFIDEWYLQRGTATHLACELLDQGRLDWSSVDPEILPRVRAYEEWARGREFIAIEKRLASREHGYAGTLDRMIRIAGLDWLILADLKNSYYPQCRLQLGAYSLLWQENYGDDVFDALIVELKEDGKVKEHWLNPKELREAERLWLAVLSVYDFAANNSLLKAMIR